jgi:hypothetical protein
MAPLSSNPIEKPFGIIIERFAEMPSSNRAEFAVVTESSKFSAYMLKRESAVISCINRAFAHDNTCFKDIFLSAFRSSPFVSEKFMQHFDSRIQRGFLQVSKSTGIDPLLKTNEVFRPAPHSCVARLHVCRLIWQNLCRGRNN